MAISVKGYAAPAAKVPLEPYAFKRRSVGKKDILIEILYCGICHSDIHQARDEWGGAHYPMVPGHEIVGVVKEIGSEVKKFKVGDHAAVGCMVNACRTCGSCKEGLEQYCEKGFTGTYSGVDVDGSITQGGYSSKIVVNEDFSFHLPKNLPLQASAPLLCAGITLYSPLKHWDVGPGKKVGIIGLGGLGHVGVKIAHAMGAEVSVLSHSDKKQEDSMRFGATHFYNTSESDILEKLAGYFDLIICTVSVGLDWNRYLNTLKRDGTMVIIGAPEGTIPVSPFSLFFKRRNLSGSLIGGLEETQEMLDFCGKHNITAEIELIPVTKINEAYERILKSDVRYRFVIDMTSLN